MLKTLAMFFVLWAGVFSGAQAQTAPRNEVDVALILAVDASRSMDMQEMQIQREGYVSALTHSDFINAVKGGMTGRVAIAYYEWASGVDEQSRIDWQIIETSQDANAFAARINALPFMTRTGTSISGAIAYGTGMLAATPFSSMRRVMDISGDGPNNIGAPVVEARDLAVSTGIVINGLALIIRPSSSIVSLDRYYADCVIGGPGSFVLPVHDIEDFETAIRRKLVMEVSGIGPSARIIPVINAQQADCMVGERSRPDFFTR